MHITNITKQFLQVCRWEFRFNFYVVTFFRHKIRLFLGLQYDIHQDSTGHCAWSFT